MKDSFENILMNSKIKPNLIETDRGKEFYNSVFQDFQNKTIIKIYSRNTYFGAVLQKAFIVI